MSKIKGIENPKFAWKGASDGISIKIIAQKGGWLPLFIFLYMKIKKGDKQKESKER